MPDYGGGSLGKGPSLKNKYGSGNRSSLIARRKKKAKKASSIKPKPRPTPEKKSAFQKITDDIQMDLGIKAKDADYYSRLADRSARSQKALADMKARRKKKGGSSSTTGGDNTTTTGGDDTLLQQQQYHYWR